MEDFLLSNEKLIDRLNEKRESTADKTTSAVNEVQPRHQAGFGTAKGKDAFG